MECPAQVFIDAGNQNRLVSVSLVQLIFLSTSAFCTILSICQANWDCSISAQVVKNLPQNDLFHGCFCLIPHWHGVCYTANDGLFIYALFPLWVVNCGFRFASPSVHSCHRLRGSNIVWHSFRGFRFAAVPPSRFALRRDKRGFAPPKADNPAPLTRLSHSVTCFFHSSNRPSWGTEHSFIMRQIQWQTEHTTRTTY